MSGSRKRLQTGAYLEKSILGTPKEYVIKNQTRVNATLLSPTEKEKAYNTFSKDTTKKQLSESLWQGTIYLK